MPSKIQGIVQEYIERVSRIRRTNDFDTDAGLAVFVGEAPMLGPDDPEEAIAIILGEQEVTHCRANVHSLWPIEIHAIARADLQQPWMTVLAIVGDIKRAIELEDRSLGGLVNPWIERVSVRTLPREAGSTTVAAVVTYMNPVVEAWGNP